MLDGVLQVVGALWQSIESNLSWIIPCAVLFFAFVAPMPRRGPASSKRDRWRSYKYGLRTQVMQRAGNRCEGAVILAWGRCSSPADEVDHVYPWSKGGATVASNGQALCRDHNRRKSNMTPPWWYLWGLERRRRNYFPQGVEVRVFASASPEERTLRER